MREYVRMWVRVCARTCAFGRNRQWRAEASSCPGNGQSVQLCEHAAARGRTGRVAASPAAAAATAACTTNCAPPTGQAAYPLPRRLTPTDPTCTPLKAPTPPCKPTRPRPAGAPEDEVDAAGAAVDDARHRPRLALQVEGQVHAVQVRKHAVGDAADRALGHLRGGGGRGGGGGLGEQFGLGIHAGMHCCAGLRCAAMTASWPPPALPGRLHRKMMHRFLHCLRRKKAPWRTPRCGTRCRRRPPLAPRRTPPPAWPA